MTPTCTYFLQSITLDHKKYEDAITGVGASFKRSLAVREKRRLELIDQTPVAIADEQVTGQCRDAGHGCIAISCWHLVLTGGRPRDADASVLSGCRPVTRGRPSHADAAVLCSFQATGLCCRPSADGRRLRTGSICDVHFWWAVVPEASEGGGRAGSAERTTDRL